MINRSHVEAILKVNGVTPTAPDEQIRSILLSARYNKDEVDTAIMVLREDTNTKKTRVDGLHKVFRSDQALNSNEIAQLLGIEVDITDRIQARGNAEKTSFVYYLALWILSVLFATGAIFFYMHMHQVGVFHPSAQAFGW
jgi:hypothetical protein